MASKRRDDDDDRPSDALLDVVALARRAGQAILDVAAAARGAPVEKDFDQGPVTEADLRADRVLRDGLAARFPDDVVVTEETWPHDAPLRPGERVWFADPLDGTREFVEGRDEYSVMVGLVERGVPVLGVVHQPSSGLTWCGDAVRGRAWRVDADSAWSPRDVRVRAVGERRLRVAVSRSHKSELALAVSRALDAETVECGSVGLKVGLILDDEADAYLSGSRRIKVWDTAGPAAIMRAAGGHFTALDVAPLAYDAAPAHGAGVRAITGDAARLFGPKIDAVVADVKARLARGTDSRDPE